MSPGVELVRKRIQRGTTIVSVDEAAFGIYPDSGHKHNWPVRARGALTIAPAIKD